MPSLVDKEFQDFIVNIGLRKDVAETLWNADIHTPQELAAYEEKDLMKITSNPLLVKNIHPLLQKFLYNISMAKNPYKKAVAILKKHAEKMEDDDDEPMEIQSGLLADSTVGDATPFRGDAESGSLESTTMEQQTEIDTSNAPSQRYSNSGMTITTSGTNTRGNRIQSQISAGGNKSKSGNQPSISITGGNFVQSNILSQGPVVYNNTNTTINTSLEQNFILDAKKRRAERLNSSMVVDGRVVRISDISWNDNCDFWVDGVSIPECDYDFYARHLALDDQIYSVRNVGSSRALILNNVHFKPGSRMDTRKGADVDGRNMKSLLEKLGFKVRMEVDKTAAEMKEIVKEFSQCRDNIRSDMVAVYIGSHGERDSEGNDTFVGTDGARVRLKDVKKFFSPDTCPGFVNKPKIFFLQFCRLEKNRSSTSSNEQPSTAVIQTASLHSDATAGPTVTTSAPRQHQDNRVMDTLSVYATLAGTKAYRDTADGSWFVTAMVRVMKEQADKDDLLSMLTKVNNSVSVNEGMEGNKRAVQVSEVVHTFRKKVYFFPGQK